MGEKKEREKFQSRLGFILVSAGCAIGLGNVWKFPYMTGQYGGAIFILLYFVFLVILALPVMACEFANGRASKKSIAGSYQALEPEGTTWHHLRWLGILGNYLLVMFYSMVGGWMLNYAYQMASGKFKGVDSAGVSAAFETMISSPASLLFWTLLVVILCFVVCGIGLQNGVEKITKFMMIGLFIIMVFLAAYTVTLPNASEGIRFYLVPDVSKLAEIGVGKIVFGAMSQAFFTLSVGMGGMAIFGSYIEKDKSLTGEALTITFLDTFVAVTAGFIVIPACFAYGVSPDSGPNLIFVTLPNIFTQLSGGRIFGTFFFLFLSFAALSTVIGVFENLISFSMDGFGWSRKKATGINMAALAILVLPCIFGFNIWSDFQPLGAGSNIMDLEDFLVSNNCLPLGGLIYVMFCTSKSGWGWEAFLAEVNAGKGLRFPRSARFYMSYVIPLVITVIYLKGYYDMFSTKGTGVLTFWMCIGVLLLGLIFFAGPIRSGMRRRKK